MAPALLERARREAMGGVLDLATAELKQHMRSVFQKLEIHESPASHRRVLAVLTYLKPPG